jgi:hypothetical protein
MYMFALALLTYCNEVTYMQLFSLLRRSMIQHAID